VTVPSLAGRAGTALLGGVLAVGLLAVGLLAGCSDDAKKSSDDPATPTSSATGSSEATDSPTDIGYLPVPAGVTLTAPGTALQLGDEATVAWQPRQDRVVALQLTVDRIDKTSFKESFEGWVVTPQMKGQTPYFVRVEATNVSDSDAGGLLVPLYALADSTSMYEPLSFQKQEFEPCPGGVLPDKLLPDKSAELCFVYLLPEGTALQSVAFDLVDEQPITWSGPITAVEKPKKDKDKKGKGDKGKGNKTDDQAG
jgi:hypothetical protein